MEFNIAIGKTGLFQMCVEDVKRVEDIPVSELFVVNNGLSLNRDAKYWQQQI